MRIVIEEKVYPDRKNSALKNVDLSFLPGKNTLIIGTSGAGKSTLIKCITGTCNFSGRIEGYSREQIAFIPQHPALNTRETAYEAVYWSALFSRKYRKRDERMKAVDKQIRSLGLYDVRDKEIRNLSGGQTQRVSIAKELVRKKNIIIADEIDTGLDCGVSRELVNSLCKIGKDEGKTTIIISHNIVNIKLYDYVVVLVKSSSKVGGIAYYGPVEGILEYFKGDEDLEVNDYVDILRLLNSKDEGGAGKADKYIKKYLENPVRL